LPPETITSCHPGYAIPNSNRFPDGTDRAVRWPGSTGT
jgi:hypothetical protein